jgi:lysophospholipase L1-like esterase
MRVLVFGDSIAQGFWDTEGGWVERLRKHYDSLALKDLRYNQQPEVFNLGISGDTTLNLLARIESETKARMWPNDPLFVVVAIGTNDDLFQSSKQMVSPEEFRDNIKQIVKILRPITQGIMFIGNPGCDETRTTPVPWGDFNYTNKELQRSEQTVEQIAHESSLPFVPVFQPFKAKLDQGADLLKDGLHPNNAGHELIFELVQPELDKLLGIK